MNESIDYEDMILSRQEEIENLLDECDGECEHCKYGKELPVRYFYEEPKYTCKLTEDNK